MLVKHCFVTGQVVRRQVTAAEQLVVPFDPNEFRYIRFRAIGNLEIDGENGNSDAFPYEHFEDDRPGYGYESFRGKRAHVEHNSDLGLAGAIGDLPDAYLNRLILPTSLNGHRYADLDSSQRIAVLSQPNQRDGSIEVLMRIDMNMVKNATRNPQLRGHVDNIIRAVDTGQKLSCSMGTDVQYSWCSVCGNEARFANEYCNDLKFKKGSTASIPANQVRDLLDAGRERVEWIKHFTKREADLHEIINGSSNKPVLMKVAEINHELSFFELSVVGRPAYSKGWELEKIASEGSPITFTMWSN